MWGFEPGTLDWRSSVLASDPLAKVSSLTITTIKTTTFAYIWKKSLKPANIFSWFSAENSRRQWGGGVKTHTTTVWAADVWWWCWNVRADHSLGNCCLLWYLNGTYWLLARGNAPCAASHFLTTFSRYSPFWSQMARHLRWKCALLASDCLEIIIY